MPTVPAARRRANNRILAVILHLKRYGCRTQARLAKDTGFSPSAISRLLCGRSSPSFSLVIAVTQALETQLGRPIPYSELVSFGPFPTPSVCELCDCPGCLPPFVYDENDNVRPEYRQIRQGKWALEFDPPGTIRVIALRLQPDKEPGQHHESCRAGPETSPLPIATLIPNVPLP